MKCPKHQMVVVFVTHTGWGDVVLPEGRMCGCCECEGHRRPKDWEHSS